MTMHPAVLNGSYDVARVREDFPALSLKVYGKPLVYLDNAASAQKPNAVLDRMTQAYKTEYANVHRGLHYLANAATEAYEGAPRQGGAISQRARNEEIVFTRNATEAINLVASSWGEPNIKAGDEIVLSIMEHHSNIVPWHFLRERHGAVIKWARVDDEGNFLIEEFEKAADRAHQAGRDHADVERARHHRAGQGRGENRPCPRHSGAGRRQPGGRASGDRCQGYRLRFLCLHRSQALRADRHRRALCQARASGGDAALQWRRRDDPRSRAEIGSPMAIRRTNSRRARRRSSRRSGLAPRSTTSIRSARSASPRTSMIF